MKFEHVVPNIVNKKGIIIDQLRSWLVYTVMSINGDNEIGDQ